MTSWRGAGVGCEACPLMSCPGRGGGRGGGQMHGDVRGAAYHAPKPSTSRKAAWEASPRTAPCTSPPPRPQPGHGPAMRGQASQPTPAPLKPLNATPANLSGNRSIPKEGLFTSVSRPTQTARRRLCAFGSQKAVNKQEFGSKLCLERVSLEERIHVPC